MSGYTKLFSSIIASTIWREPDHVRVVWITLLAMSDQRGVVEAAVPGLADMARVSLEQCEDALNRLRAPDPYSRTKDHDGRRIEDIDGGFLILNRTKYRDKMSEDDRREYQREYRANYRANGRDKSRPVNTGQHRSTLVNTGQELSTRSIQTETETEEENNSVGANAPTVPAANDEDWLASLETNPAYQGINVRSEYAKMRAWCEVNRKQPTRRRFISWLNRIDRPMSPTTGAATAPAPAHVESPTARGIRLEKQMATVRELLAANERALDESRFEPALHAQHKAEKDRLKARLKQLQEEHAAL